MEDIGRLYEEHASAVFRYIMSRGFDEQTTADLLQETFLAAWRQRDGFSGASRPLTWLIGIARHKLADETRRRERNRAAPAEQSEESRDFSEEADERITLENALGCLDAGQRELLGMVMDLGLTYSEIARILEVPEGTVKSRMFQIRSFLKAKMEGGSNR